MEIGTNVRTGIEDWKLPLGTEGIVVKPPLRAVGHPERTWIRWDSRVLATGYRPGHRILEHTTALGRGEDK